MAISPEDQARLDELHAADVAELSATPVPRSGDDPAAAALAATAAQPGAPRSAHVRPEDQARLDELNAADLSASFTPGAGVKRDASGGIGIGQGPDEAQQSPGMLGSLMEHIFKANDRKPELEKYPDWLDMPEMDQWSKNAVVAHLGTLAAGIDDTKKIVEKQFPGVKVRKDGGYLLMTSPTDGQTYAWKPGWRWSDTRRGLEGAIATLPIAAAAAPAAGAGLATTVGLGALGGLGQAAALEEAKVAAGGDFSPSSLAGGLLVGGAVPLAGRALGVAKNLVTGAAPEAEAAAAAAAQAAGAPASPQAVKALGATMGQAARGSQGAIADVATQVRPDPEIIAAAERQDLLPHLQPDHVSTNDAFQQLAQTIKQAPGTGAVAKQAEDNAVKALGDRLKSTIVGAGGEANLAEAGYVIKDAVEKQLAENRAATKAAYKIVEDAIPKNAPAPASNLIAEIDGVAANRNGVLPKWLQKIRGELVTADGRPPTWDTLNSVKQRIGAATKGQGPYGTAAKGEPGLAKQLFAAGVKDVEEVAKNHGQSVHDAALKSTAAANLEGAYKRDVVEAFGNRAGRQLAGSTFEDAAMNKVARAAGPLAQGRTDPFITLMKAVPEELRPKVALSSLYHSFLDGGKGTLQDFVERFEGLQSNSRALKALTTYAPKETMENLGDLYTVAKGVTGAMGKSAGSSVKTLFPESNGFVRDLLGIAGAHAVGGAANAVGIPIPHQVVSDFVLKALLTPKEPIMEALSGFITSPAGRLALEHAASGAPIPIGRLANIAASPFFQRMMTAANIAPSAREQWLTNALSSAAVSSPPRAGLTQQPEAAQ